MILFSFESHGLRGLSSDRLSQRASWVSWMLRSAAPRKQFVRGLRNESATSNARRT